MAPRREWYDVSCYIDKDFFMVTMRERSLERFLGDVRAAGRPPLYAMRPPIHSSAFGSLRRRVEDEVLGDFRFGDPRLPIVTDCEGSVAVTADQAHASRWYHPSRSLACRCGVNSIHRYHEDCGLGSG
jgi:[acyl-carrier-protein] S-malonyltransferase